MRTKHKIITGVLCLFSFLSFAQTRDSLVYSTVTKSVTHDTSYVIHASTTHDSSFVKVDTLKIPIPTQVTLKGMYTHPNQLTIGDQVSENNYLAWCKREGTNMLNCYARAYLYTEAKRIQLAAFVAKAKTNYGIVLVTVDVRFTNSSEQPGWEAYMAKYAGTISQIEPLTEFEPWVKNSSGVYDYAGFFYLVRTMGNMCKKYHVKFNYYEGWVGNNYNGLSFSQAPVDSMVKYCDRIFISNYVSVSDYNSTSTSLGKWDNRMDKRCGYIATGCKNMGKASIDILEIISLERILWGASNDFLGSLFVSNPFYGSTYSDDVNAYNLYSTPLVIQYTDVTGRTMFYSKYALLAHPN